MSDSKVGLSNGELVHLIQKCLRNKDCLGGRKLHSVALLTGLHTQPAIAPLLIRILGTSIETVVAASSTFCTLLSPSLESWHAIIASYSTLGQHSTVLQCYNAMLCNGISLSQPIYLIALKACSTLCTLIEGMLVHHNIVLEGINLDVYISSALVHMYAGASCLREARNIFDSINEKTAVFWNAMLAGYVHSGHGHLAIELFADMEHMPDQVTLTSVIKACGMVSSLKQGQFAHQIAVESGLAASQYVTSSLINMYVQCGALDEAQQLFTNLPQRSVVLWNALISGYVCHGNNQSAVDCFIKMQEEKIIPNNRTISIVLKACGNLCLQEQGSILYALMLEKSIVEDEILLVALVDMYVNCGDLEAAHSILNVTRSVPKAAWGAMLAGCAQQENGLLALEVYGEMQHKSIDADAAIYACIIKAAGLVGALEEGKLIHDQLIRHDLETNIVIGSALTDMYNKCGALDNGLNVYKALQKQDLVSWSTMISGYVQHGSHSSALKLFEQLKAEGVEPDKVMYSSILNACGGLRAVEQGKWLHHDINISEFHHDESLWTALINMYCQCGYLEEAISLFERITVKTLLAWSAIILGHIQNGSVQAALCFFSRMQSSGINVDETILMSLLKTCGNSEQLNFMHERIKQMGFDSHLGIGNSLIDMYGKIGDLTMARKVFDCSPCKDVVTWNSMIAAYAEHSLISPLLELYGEMQLVGLESDAFTFSCMLKACRKVREIDLGNLIFDQVIRKSFETDAVIIRSLIEMYAELGSLDDAMKVFDIPVNGLSSWSTMIGAFAENNNFELALKFFEDRQKHGWKPDDKVLTSFLASISHSGQWERGQSYLNLLNEGSGFDPKLEHMNCAVDLLGRSGHICEAGELLQALPQPPDMIGLTSLLSSCKSHGSDLQEMLVQKVGY